LGGLPSRRNRRPVLTAANRFNKFHRICVSLMGIATATRQHDVVRVMQAAFADCLDVVTSCIIPILLPAQMSSLAAIEAHAAVALEDGPYCC